MTAKKNAPRKVKYNSAKADRICKRLAEGESLNKICKSFGNVCRATVYNWLADKNNKEFLDKYTQASERQAETFIDECADIADDNEQDTILVIGKDGKEYERVNHDHINRSRLRVDTRIKIAEKLAPRKYTPQSKVENTGSIEINVGKYADS